MDEDGGNRVGGTGTRDHMQNPVIEGSPPQSRAPSQTPVRSRRLQFYFANVTSWSQRAGDRLKMRSSTMAHSDMIAVAEHHRRGPALTQVIKRLGKLGWATTAVPAAETGTAVVRERPGHGGVLVAAAKHLCQRGLSQEVKEGIQAPEHMGLATQWTARVARAQRREILFCLVYLAPGLGLDGTNVITLQELGANIKAMGLEFVWGG